MKQVECSQLKLKTSNKITNGDRLAKTLREASLYVSYGGPPPSPRKKLFRNKWVLCVAKKRTHTPHLVDN